MMKSNPVDCEVYEFNFKNIATPCTPTYMSFILVYFFSWRVVCVRLRKGMMCCQTKLSHLSVTPVTPEMRSRGPCLGCNIA